MYQGGVCSVHGGKEPQDEAPLSKLSSMIMSCSMTEIAVQALSTGWLRRSSDTHKGLKVDPLLLHVEFSQLRWFHAGPSRKRAWRDYLSADFGNDLGEECLCFPALHQDKQRVLLPNHIRPTSWEGMDLRPICQQTR